MTETRVASPPISLNCVDHEASRSDGCDHADLLQQLEAELLAMPPVAALGLRIEHAGSQSLRLRAPLAAHTNDKGCAFGGSLSSLMTLAGWSLVTLELLRAGVEADVYVAESTVKYRAPLYDDLHAEAHPIDAAAFEALAAAVADEGRGELHVQAKILRRDGVVACRSRSRFVVKRRD